MQDEMEKLRKAIGPYVMTFVRSVFPAGALNVWARMELVAAQTGPADVQKWARILATPQTESPQDGVSAAPTDAPKRSVFGTIQAQADKPKNTQS